jgi:hypothetical protein
VQLQATSIYGIQSDYAGYSIKAYYTDLYGKEISTQTVALGSDGLAEFTPPSGTYGMSYEIIDSAGEIVSESEKILSGNADYWALTEPLPVYLTTEDEEVSGNPTIIEDDTSKVTDLDLSVFGMNDAQIPDNYGNSSSASIGDTGYYAKIKIASDYNLDLMQDQGLYIYAQTTSEAYRIDITEISTDFQQYSLPSGEDYTFGVYENKTKVWKDITVTESSPNQVTVNVTPTCLLYITNGNNPVNIKVNSKAFSYDQQAIFGVVNGDTYSIINTDNNRVYSFVVPSNVTACALDLSTATGVPINESALQDAQLTNTGDYDNPYNIPLTNQSTAVNYAETFGVFGVISAVFLGLCALLTKKLSK